MLSQPSHCRVSIDLPVESEKPSPLQPKMGSCDAPQPPMQLTRYPSSYCAGFGSGFAAGAAAGAAAFGFQNAGSVFVHVSET
jgi:hypothetical protein